MTEHNSSYPCPQEAPIKEQGRTINRIEGAISEFRDVQKNMANAMVDMARSQERIIALADRTAVNQKDVENLYALIRELDKTMTKHILQSGHSMLGKSDTKLVTDTKFDKLQVALITGIGLAALNALWDILQGLVSQVQILMKP